MGISEVCNAAVRKIMKTDCASHVLAIAFVFNSLWISLGAEPPGSGRTPESDTPPSKDEIRSLLVPISFDMPSKSETANMDRIVEYGPRVLPVLAELLSERGAQADLINRILVVSSRVQGDKNPIVVRLPGLLQNSDRTVRIDAIKALQKWGSTSDCQYLLPLMTAEEESVRIHALRAMGSLGDRNTADALQRNLAKWESKLAPEKRRTDSTLKYGHMALSNIVERTTHNGSTSQRVPK